MSDPNLPQQWKRETCEQSIYGIGKMSSTAPSISSTTITASTKSFTDIENTFTNLRPNNISIVSGSSSVTSSNENYLPHQELQKIVGLSKTAGCVQMIGGIPSRAADQFPNDFNTVVNAISSELTGISEINSEKSDNTALIPNPLTDDEKLRKMQQIVEAGIGDQAKQQILTILERISALKPAERLLLYLRLPGGAPETDPLRQPQNPLGTRSEINHTINWVRSHLEHDPEVSIPKQDVYNDYIAYCERLDIKPLSTADFGKVMKQVFPEIRPRRLGTRGHSRYCYAAMRKTTKLAVPQLPELGSKGFANVIDNFNMGLEEDEWKAIKIWSEGILSTSFQNCKELADHIHKHHLNTPASNSSRLLLQKKLLQKEAKEKRKFSDSGPLKKRRKKKRKGSSSSDSNAVIAQSTDEHTISSSVATVKQEIFEPTSHVENMLKASPKGTKILPHNFDQPQILPMNLATEHDRGFMGKIRLQEQTQDENSICDTDNNILDQNLSQARSPSVASTSIISIDENVNSKNITTVKEEIVDDYNPTIVLCKKVRQAQQAKGLWSATTTATLPSSSLQSSIAPVLLPNTPPSNEQTSQSVSTINYAMGSPAQMDFSQIPERINESAIVASRNSQQIRAKKLRCLQARYEIYQQNAAQQLKADTTDPTGVDKDVLPENLGIPRERVISICNMDKHELDDYLNGEGEENSQDQEAELMQYFQTEETDTNKNTIVGEKNINTNNNITVNNLTTGTLVCNSVGWQNLNKNDKKICNLSKDREEITNLRNYLQQNFNKEIDMSVGSLLSTSSLPGVTVIKSLQNQKNIACDQFTDMYSSCSASASLAIMSQRHITDNIQNVESNNSTSENAQTNNRIQKRKLNSNARPYVPNSPNTRRKNFSFVPISPNINDGSLFASPRSTPIIRKPPLNKQQSLPLSDQNLSDPMIGANRSGRTGLMSALNSASAPPSPSLIQQRFQFTNNSGNCGTVGNSILSSSFTVPNINGSCLNHIINGRGCNNNQCGNEITNDCNVDSSSSSCLNSETRSQSVPLHCRSPAFNSSSNYTGFSSTCSSVAQTPVPQEFADFTDPSSILEIFSNTSNDHQSSIKMEDPSGTSLLDVNNSISFSGLIGADYEREPTMNSAISRSVPSTPNIFSSNMRRMIGNMPSLDTTKYSNKMYDISKSVPTTPIGHGMSSSSFRYSPEFNRDVLINGNTIESMPSPYQPNNLMSESIESSLGETIHDLSSFDVSGSNFDSDILNNL